jgi:membrane associated rhomboid family serine protease
MITRLLILCNVAAYIWEISVAGPGALSIWGGDLTRVLLAGALFPYAVLHDGQWWRIVTSAFLHGGLMHLGVNMLSLWILGRFIEYAVGPWRMALIYMISLVASGLGVVYSSGLVGGPTAGLTPTVGASGAIFGLFGALFAVGFRLGPPGMQLIRANIGILVINLIISFTVPSISWQAHVCGLLAGFVATLLIYTPPVRLAPVVVDANTGAALETEYQGPPQTPPQRT